LPFNTEPIQKLYVRQPQIKKLHIPGMLPASWEYSTVKSFQTPFIESKCPLNKEDVKKTQKQHSNSPQFQEFLGVARERENPPSRRNSLQRLLGDVANVAISIVAKGAPSYVVSLEIAPNEPKLNRHTDTRYSFSYTFSQYSGGDPAETFGLSAMVVVLLE
jgi:hypothetical protein